MTPLIIIEKKGDLFSIRSIGLDPDPGAQLSTALQPNLWPLRGQIADCLYVALAGHRFGTGPDLATANLARHYRAHIARWACLHADWILAHVTIQHFNHWYQPWLGLVKIGPDKQIILDDPDYQRRYLL